MRRRNTLIELYLTLTYSLNWTWRLIAILLLFRSFFSFLLLILNQHHFLTIPYTIAWLLSFCSDSKTEQSMSFHWMRCVEKFMRIAISWTRINRISFHFRIKKVLVLHTRILSQHRNASSYRIFIGHSIQITSQECSITEITIPKMNLNDASRSKIFWLIVHDSYNQTVKMKTKWKRNENPYSFKIGIMKNKFYLNIV